MMPEFYDGGSSLSDYLGVFDTTSRLNGWNDGEKADFLFTHLRGPAREVACSLSDEEQRSYQSLEEVLTIRFGPGQQAELYLAELRSCHRKSGEGLRELGDSVRRLTDLAYPDMLLMVCFREHV